MSDSWRDELVTKGAAFKAVEDKMESLLRQFGYDSYEKADEKIRLAYDGMMDALTAIYNMPPSAQPKWIPVSERPPKVGQWVLCQCRAGIMDVLRLTDDDCWYRKSNEIYMSGFVIAWMPIPEPWKNTRGEK